MNHLQHTSSLIASLQHDIRAEVIINHLTENGDLETGLYEIHNEGQFARAYRFDVLEAKVWDHPYTDQSLLVFNLSRDGLYDTLPEGISHTSTDNTPGKEVDTMILEYHARKKQQKAARKFFRPFEGEIFGYGVKTESFESALLFELNGSKAPEMFYTFWDIDHDFPPMLISKFIRLLPFAYKIVGNISQAARILSLLLEEKVEVNEKPYRKYHDKNEETLLGESRLGVDSITGNDYDDYTGHLEIKIGPLRNSRLADFIHEGKKKKFTDMFYEYFFPVEIDISTTVLLDESEEKFEISSLSDAFLGYNTCI